MINLQELLAKLVLQTSYSEFVKACKESDISPQLVLDLLESNGYTRL